MEKKIIVFVDMQNYDDFYKIRKNHSNFAYQRKLLFFYMRHILKSIFHDFSHILSCC